MTTNIYDEADEVHTLNASLLAEDAVEADREATLVLKLRQMKDNGDAPVCIRLRERILKRAQARRSAIAAQLGEVKARSSAVVKALPELHPDAALSERGRILRGRLSASRMSLGKLEQTIKGGFVDDYRRARAAELRDEVSYYEGLLIAETGGGSAE